MQRLRRVQGGVPAGAPICPDMDLPPQHVLDSAPEDGPVSVAYGMRVQQADIRQQWPSPNTRQYLHRGMVQRESRRERAPRRDVDIAGFVMAGPTMDLSEEHNQQDEERMNLRLNQFRLVYQCISAWTLMLWHSQEDFEAGFHGGRYAPRPLAWFDLRRAYDVHLEKGDVYGYLLPFRITVMTATGSYYFCVEAAQDVNYWVEALWRTIQDASWQKIMARDTIPHQQRRWPAVCGIANALFRQHIPVGERAMAILFHAYNIDCSNRLGAGEVMLLLQELIAGLIHVEGHAEAQDRNMAVLSAASRVTEDELFDLAMKVRRRMCSRGEISKDEFIIRGAAALAEAISATGLALDLGAEPPDPGSFFANFSLL